LKNSISNSNKKEKKIEDYEALAKKKQVPKSRVHTTMDWKSTNTELTFKEAGKIESDKMLTPKKVKIQANSSSLDMRTDPESLFLNINLKSDQENVNNFNDKVGEVSKLLQEKFAMSANNPK
jgi:hypothetical protein